MIKYLFMSREMMNSETLTNSVPEDIKVNHVDTKKKSQNKVDINLLMSRVREDEKKEIIVINFDLSSDQIIPHCMASETK